MPDFNIIVKTDTAQAESAINSLRTSLDKLADAEGSVEKATKSVGDTSTKTFSSMEDFNKALAESGQAFAGNELEDSFASVSKEMNKTSKGVDAFSKKLKNIPVDIGKFAAGALTGLGAGLAIGVVGKLFEPPSREDLQALVETNDQIEVMGINFTKLAAKSLEAAKAQDEFNKKFERQAAVLAKATAEADAVIHAEEALRITTEAMNAEVREGSRVQADATRAIVAAQKAYDDASGKTAEYAESLRQVLQINSELGKLTKKIEDEGEKQREKRKQAAAKLVSEVRSLRDEYDAVGAAERELAETMDTLTKAQLSSAESIHILVGAYRKLQEARAAPALAAAEAATKAEEERADLAKERMDEHNRQVEEALDKDLEWAETGAKLDKDLAEMQRDRNKEIAEERERDAKELAAHFRPVEDALVDLATKGKADWSAMVDAMIADLTRLAAQKIILSIAEGIGGAAHGADFMVGGSGGTDTQLVMFRATPKERVRVTTPGQEAAAAMPAGAPPVVRQKIVNVIDPRMAIDAMSSSEGESVTLNHIRSNASAIKALLR